MIAVDPEKRPTFDNLLHTSRGTIFPESFYTFFHDFFTSICRLTAESPFTNTDHRTSSSIPSAKPSVIPENAASNIAPEAVSLPNESDRRLDRLWSEYDSLEPHVTPYVKPDTFRDAIFEYTTNYDMSRPLHVCSPLLLILHRPDRLIYRTYFRSSYTSQVKMSRLATLLISSAMRRTTVRF